MAYTKTVWEDLPSEDTPATAEALNNMEDGIEDAHTVLGTTSATEIGYVKGVTSAIQTQLNTLQPNIMTAVLASDLTSTGVLTKAVLKSHISVGTKLTISNGSIKIGAGVSHVKVSANARITTNTANMLIAIQPHTSTQTWIGANAVICSSAGTYGLSFASTTIAVSQNDLVSLSFYRDTGIITATSNDIFTQLTVEVID